jgi:hypothetical protein
MSGKTTRRQAEYSRRPNRKSRFNRNARTQVIVALVGGAAVVLAALITSITTLVANSGSASGTGPSSGTAATTATEATQAAPSATAGTFAPGQSLPPGTIPETEEEVTGVPSFTNYVSMTSKGNIPMGQVVGVYCRIPGDASTPATVGSAGWYKIMNPDHTFIYAGANAFFNDPGNGYGMEHNNIPFDPRVPICESGT